MTPASPPVLSPGRAAVIAPADPDAGYVWLPANGHALMITALSRQPSAATVVLSGPLGGSWTTDHPSMSSPPRTSRHFCTLILTGRLRLVAALNKSTPVDPEENHHVHP